MADASHRHTCRTVIVAGVLAFGMATGACRSEPGAPTERAVAAPVAGDVSRNLGEADDGQGVQVAVGERFSVTLASWAEWRVDQSPDFLSHAETLMGPTADTRATGSDQWQVLVFEAQAPGEGELRLVLGRPWSEGDRMEEYRLTVRAAARTGAGS